MKIHSEPQCVKIFFALKPKAKKFYPHCSKGKSVKINQCRPRKPLTTKSACLCSYCFWVSGLIARHLFIAWLIAVECDRRNQAFKTILFSLEKKPKVFLYFVSAKEPLFATKTEKRIFYRVQKNSFTRFVLPKKEPFSFPFFLLCRIVVSTSSICAHQTFVQHCIPIGLQGTFLFLLPHLAPHAFLTFLQKKTFFSQKSLYQPASDTANIFWLRNLDN